MEVGFTKATVQSTQKGTFLFSTRAPIVELEERPAAENVADE